MSLGRVLLIDDDAKFRKLLSVMLTAARYDVQEAADGNVGIALYQQQRTHVVITDILMPLKDGLETIRELRRLDPHVKIIAMSSTPEQRFGYLSTAAEFGAQRILHKPFTRKELLAVLAEVTGA